MDAVGVGDFLQDFMKAGILQPPRVVQARHRRRHEGHAEFGNFPRSVDQRVDRHFQRALLHLDDLASRILDQRLARIDAELEARVALRDFLGEPPCGHVAAVLVRLELVRDVEVLRVGLKTPDQCRSDREDTQRMCLHDFPPLILWSGPAAAPAA